MMLGALLSACMVVAASGHAVSLAIMQRMSDLRTSRSACSPHRWVNETCWMDVEWQAVAAAGLLAVDDFNARDGRYVPAFAGVGMQNCDKKLNAMVYDSVCLPACREARCRSSH